MKTKGRVLLALGVLAAVCLCVGVVRWERTRTPDRFGRRQKDSWPSPASENAKRDDEHVRQADGVRKLEPVDVRGVVRLFTAPAPGVHVTAVALGTESRPGMTVEADQEGRFQLSVAARTDFVLTARHGRGASGSILVHGAPAGASRTVTVSLLPLAPVRGRVLSHDRRPAAGARVTCRRPRFRTADVILDAARRWNELGPDDPVHEFVTTTDGDGAYRFDVPVGSVVQLSVEGLRRETFASTSRSVDFVLPERAAPTATEVATDRSGGGRVPPAGAGRVEGWIENLVPGRHQVFLVSDRREWRTSVDAAGRFLFGAVPPLDKAFVVLDTPRRRTGPFAVSAREVVNVKLTLPALAAITGRVTDPTGAGVSGVAVHVSWAGTYVDIFLAQPGTRSTTLTDDHGRFEIPLQVEQWRVPVVSVVARHPEFAPALIAGVKFPEPGGVTVANPRLKRGRIVAGCVIDREGRPVTNAVVELEPAFVQDWSTGSLAFRCKVRTTADGDFRFGPQPPGAYRLTARVAGATTGPQHVTAGAERIVLAFVNDQD